MLGKSVFQSDLFGLGVTCLHLLTNVEPFTLYDVLENEYQWRQFLNGKVVSNELGKLLDRLTAYRVKERPNSVIETLQECCNQEVVLVKPALLPIVPSQPVQSPASNSSNSLVLDCGNVVKLELIKVAAGSFDMGSNEFDMESHGYDSEKPSHRVNLREFFIGKYPVTQAQYQAVMGNNPSIFKGDQNPVEYVSWLDARRFCAKLSQQTGQEIRLPTEAEWEYAAKGGNQSKNFTYAGSNGFYEVGWCCDNSGSVTHPVGQEKANELGIYDMSGNVWEWCLDEWHDSYANKPENLKQQGNQTWGKIDENDNRYRLARGGSWLDNATYCRSAYRKFFYANTQRRIIGFRVVL